MYISVYFLLVAQLSSTTPDANALPGRGLCGSRAAYFAVKVDYEYFLGLYEPYMIIYEP